MLYFAWVYYAVWYSVLLIRVSVYRRTIYIYSITMYFCLVRFRRVADGHPGDRVVYHSFDLFYLWPGIKYTAAICVVMFDDSDPAFKMSVMTERFTIDYIPCDSWLAHMLTRYKVPVMVVVAIAPVSVNIVSRADRCPAVVAFILPPGDPSRSPIISRYP